jgi:hypothetical protein
LSPFIGAAAIAVGGVLALNYIQGLISVVFATSATRT